MSIADTRQIPQALTRGDAPRLSRVLSSPWLSFGLVLAAIALQAAGHLDCDVSWFITFAEKYVDGAVPYVDVTDPNPPASFLFFAPAVKLARAMRVAVEPVAAGLVFAFACFSIALSALVFRFGARRSREDCRLLLNAAIFILLLAPGMVFGEREHIALLAMAAMLSTLAVTGEGGRAPVWLRALAGAGAGIALCFKPFFVLPILAPALAIAWRLRSPRLLFCVETVIAGATALACAVIAIYAFPSYFSLALPVVRDVYQPAHAPYAALAFESLAPFNIALLVALAVATARGFASPPEAPAFVAPAPALVCAFASLGFLVSFFVQGKGWMNHAYPGMALALLAFVFCVLDRRPRAAAMREGKLFKFIFLPLVISAPVLFGGLKVLLDIEEHPGLRAAIARVAPAHPRIIAMARQLDYGHPVTRQLQGSWVGRPNALFTASFAAWLLGEEKDPARRALLEDYRQRDLAGFAQDVRAGKPDVIVVEDAGTREAVLKRPESAGVLDAFDRSGQVGEIEIWTRKAR